VSTSVPGSLIVGSNGTYNALVILAGGSVTNTGIGTIGFLAGADFNSVYVTNSGSAWLTMGTLTVGGAGVNNSLTIADGGKVVSGIGPVPVGANIGHGGGSNNAVFVYGATSVWSNNFDIIVGRGSSFNSLVISNGRPRDH
jgi:T5SS/PEP-CTERM-associated repeat protein